MIFNLYTNNNEEDTIVFYLKTELNFDKFSSLSQQRKSESLREKPSEK